MKRVMMILFVCCAGIGLSSGAEAEVIDKILAVLDEELILLSEVREFAAKPVNQIVANLEHSSDVDRDALDYLIEQRLLQREIKYLAFPKEPERVLSVVMEYMSATYHDGDIQSLTRQLQQRGIPQTALETALELYMKGVDYIRRKYRFNADSNDPEVVLNLFQQLVRELRTKADIHTSF